MLSGSVFGSRIAHLSKHFVQPDFSASASRVVRTMATANTPPRVGKLCTTDTALLVCDVQERFRQLIFGFPAVVDTSRRMIRAASALSVPVLVTEQYPKALGNTVSELKEVLPEHCPVVAKTKFSMCTDEIDAELAKLDGVKKVLVVGLETHVCVLQTTLDLIESGYEVHILVDGVSSQRQGDRSIALQRLSQSGAFLSSSEMVMFQMMVNTSHPAFKTISGLCKESRADPLPPA